ncbi:UNVERIFIED_CONTAM: hypothetical protein Sradi_3845200 [Sesamum radiatum]|uniref:Reverse transcriptase zinc-binding domain-containing protein n=1 Tax=Sesamum radiatum TaxID=300843 RepID=A0AAW2Q1M8_SESRA
MALESYWAMAFILPKGIIKEVEKRLRSFLWRGTSNRGYQKVAWDLICRPYEEGGLGVRDVLALNQALMSKNLWDVIRGKRDSIWLDWIFQNRLRDQTVWVARENTGSWSWRKLLTLRAALIPHIQFRIGDGANFSLWNDPWHNLGPLITHFPRGPQVTRTCPSNSLDTVIEVGQWRWPLITDIEHLDILHLLPDIHGGDDSIAWIPDGGNFSSSFASNVFRPPGPTVGWSLLLVGFFRIPRHCFILWLAILGKLSTLDKPWLGHLGRECVLCSDGQEKTHEHLFFTCSYSRRCVTTVRQRVRFPWPYQDWQRGILWASVTWRNTHMVCSAYRALLASIVYHIWQERNRRRFQGIERPSFLLSSMAVEEVKQRIVSVNLGPFVSTRGLYCLWQISWPVEGGADFS